MEPRASRQFRRGHCAQCHAELAMTLGASIGYLMGRVRLANRLAILADPAAEPAGARRIGACDIWAGLTEVAAVRAIAINKLPTAVVTVREGPVHWTPRLTKWRRCCYTAGGRCGMYIAAVHPISQRRAILALLFGRSSWSPIARTLKTVLASRSRRLPAIRHSLFARLFAEFLAVCSPSNRPGAAF